LEEIKNTYKILKQILARNLRLENSASFALPEYTDLTEMMVQKEMDKKASMAGFQHMRRLKKVARKEQKTPRCMIRYSSDFRLYWD